MASSQPRRLEKLVQENRRLWGFLPFKKYLFLNVFRQGGGGLEHKNSTLLTASPPRAASYPARNFRWLSFVSHEYFHAFNVKRLRPIELGPFDYEQSAQHEQPLDFRRVYDLLRRPDRGPGSASELPRTF